MTETELASSLLVEARAAIQHGETAEALQKLADVRKLTGITPEVTMELERIERQTAILSQIEHGLLDAMMKRASGSSAEALDAFRELLRTATNPDSGLPDSVRSNLTTLLGLEGSLHIGDTEQKAEAITESLALGAVPTRLMRDLLMATRAWLDLAVQERRMGLLRSRMVLGQYVEAYASALKDLERFPTNESFLRIADEARLSILSQLRESVQKRVGRAVALRDAGAFAEAQAELERIDSEFLKHIEQNFPEMLHDDELGRLRDQVADLRSDLAALLEVTERLNQNVNRARTLIVEGQLEEARRVLEEARLIDPHGRARLLQEQCRNLRQIIDQMLQEHLVSEVQHALHEAEAVLDLDNSEDETIAVLEKLSQQRVTLDKVKFLDVEELRARLRDLQNRAREQLERQQRVRIALEQAQNQLESVDSEDALQRLSDELENIGKTKLSRQQESQYLAVVTRLHETLLRFGAISGWREQARHLIEEGDYDAAIAVLEQVEQSSNDFQMTAMLAEVKRKRDLRREQEKALIAGRAALARKEYAEAIKAFSAAQALGSDAEDYLRAAQAGQFVTVARAKLEAGDQVQAELALQQALQVGQNREPAFEIVREAYRLQNELAFVRFKSLVEQAERLAAQLLLDKAKALVDQAHGLIAQMQDDRSVLLSNPMKADLITRASHLRRIIDSALPLLSKYANAQFYLTKDAQSEEAVHLLDDILRCPEENEVVREIKRLANWLLVAKNQVEEGQQLVEVIALQRIANDLKATDTWERWERVQARARIYKTTDEASRRSYALLEGTVRQLENYRVQTLRDAQIWKWLSFLAAVIALALLTYAVVFLIQASEPLTYLSTLPAILTGVAAPFIHKFYSQMIDQVNVQYNQVLEQWKQYVAEETMRRKAMEQTILGYAGQLPETSASKE